MVDYDQAYRENADYFGTEMVPFLARFRSQIPDGARVLDIGMGQGRNCLPLARQGCRVTGIDISGVAVETVRELAAREDLALDLWHGSYLDFEPTGGPFDAVLCFGILQSVDRSQGASLLHRLRLWTRPGGVVFLTAWHVDDPAFGRISETWQRVGLHSFRDTDGGVSTFLARGEVLDLMLGWDVVHHWEGLGPEHRHGGGQPERHGAVEVVAVRWHDRR